VTDLPITVGFGISNAQQVRSVTRVADAAIVGSALVKQIGKHLDDDPNDIARAAGEFTAELATGLS
jgi:tryptophan synthase alpha chain